MYEITLYLLLRNALNYATRDMENRCLMESKNILFDSSVITPTMINVDGKRFHNCLMDRYVFRIVIIN